MPTCSQNAVKKCPNRAFPSSCPPFCSRAPFHLLLAAPVLDRRSRSACCAAASAFLRFTKGVAWLGSQASGSSSSLLNSSSLCQGGCGAAQ